MSSFRSQSQHPKSFLDTTSLAPRFAPSIPNGGTYSVLGHTIINAPPQVVYDAMLDVSRYGEWNTFVTKVDITKAAAGQSDLKKMAKGTHMKFTVDMGNASPSTSYELVTHVDPLKLFGLDDPELGPGGNPSYRTTVIRWCLDNGAAYTPGFVLRTEHVNEILDLGDGRCEFIHWETMAGIVAGIVKSRYGEHLRKKWAAWGEELKAYVEGKGGKEENTQ